MRRMVVLTMLCVACAAIEGRSEGRILEVGVGVFGDNVYFGSDDRYLAPVPTFNWSYTRQSITYACSLMDGLCVSWVNPEHHLLGSIGVNAGKRRKRDEYSRAGVDVDHSDRTQRLLEGSPNLSVPVTATATLGYLSPVGILGASVAYHPTDVESADIGIEDETVDGLLYSLLYMIELPVNDRLSISGLLSIEFMDQNYADAWYSVDRETAAVSVFAANAGLRDIQIALEACYDISERVGMTLTGASTILLADARACPYTAEKIQQTISIEVFYRF